MNDNQPWERATVAEWGPPGDRPGYTPPPGTWWTRLENRFYTLFFLGFVSGLLPVTVVAISIVWFNWGKIHAPWQALLPNGGAALYFGVRVYLMAKRGETRAAGGQIDSIMMIAALFHSVITGLLWMTLYLAYPTPPML